MAFKMKYDRYEPKESQGISWDKDSKPYPKVGQIVMDGINRKWQITKFDRKTMYCAMDRIS